ncbi:hypothetical protein ACFV2G_31325, partial [Streptomyces sp. NPDC059701]
MRTSLGIDSVARSVYIAMVDRPGAQVSELAEHLEETEETVRSGLERLSALLLVVPGDSASGWRPVDPEVGGAAVVAPQPVAIPRRPRPVWGSRRGVSRLLSVSARGG